WRQRPIRAAASIAASQSRSFRRRRPLTVARRPAVAGGGPLSFLIGSWRSFVLAQAWGHGGQVPARRVKAAGRGPFSAISMYDDGITPFIVTVLLILLMCLPFIIKWFSTGSTYGLYTAVY